MYKHALALGYFFLAVFCAYVSAQTFAGLSTPLLMGAFAAAAIGAGYLYSAFSEQLRVLREQFSALVREAQEPPPREFKAPPTAD